MISCILNGIKSIVFIYIRHDWFCVSRKIKNVLSQYKNDIKLRKTESFFFSRNKNDLDKISHEPLSQLPLILLYQEC